MYNHLKGKFTNIADIFIDFIFPYACINCNRIIKRKNHNLCFCEQCLKKVQAIFPPFCENCSTPFINTMEYHRICEKCKDSKLYFDYLYSATEYNDVITTMIYAYKYKKKFFLAEDIAEFMIENLNSNCLNIDFKKIDMILSVPLYPRKKRERGFNQSELLAKHISEKNNINFRNNILKRVKDTSTQSKLKVQDRKKNVKGAFKVVRPEMLKNKKILLIDDICTTGATVNECSKVIKASGAREVNVLVFSKAIKD